MGRRRVVITGAGTINALGHSIEETVDAMAKGRSGIGPLDIPDVEQPTLDYEVPDFSIPDVEPFTSVDDAPKEDKANGKKKQKGFLDSSSSEEESESEDEYFIPHRFAARLIQMHPMAVIQQCESGDTPLHLLISNICHRRKEIKSANSANDNGKNVANNPFDGSDPYASMMIKAMLSTLMGPPDVEIMCPLLTKNVDSVCNCMFIADS